MNTTRWVFVCLFAAAIAYEIIALAQQKGNTISQMVWELCEVQPMWRYALVVLCLHFVLGAKAYRTFLGLFK